jgi:hypothetical protein
MGVGNYRDNFHGTGATIAVDGPLGTDEDYEAYVKDFGGAEDDTPMPRDAWSQDEYDQANEDLIHVVRSALADVGFQPAGTGRFGSGRCDFDNEFVSIAEGDVLEVGWRSWQHDFVVAVGPNSSFSSYAEHPQSYAGEIISERGMPPQAFKDAYDALVVETEEYLRLSLLKAGLKTTRPTTSYTSSSDALPPDAGERIEALAKSLKDGFAKLTRPAEDVVSKATTEERLAIAKAILALHPSDAGDAPAVVVPTYVTGGSVSMWRPGEGDGLIVSATVPGELRDYMDTLPEVDDFVPIPFNETTEAWFASRQERSRGKHVILSAEQFATITGEDCELHWEDEDEKTSGVAVVHPAPAPASSLAP